MVLFIIVYVLMAFLFSTFIETPWSWMLALLVSWILTFHIKRRSWERNILKGLPPYEQDYFFRSIYAGNAELERMVHEESEHADFKDNLLKTAMLGTLSGLADMDDDEASEVIDLYERYGHDPYERNFMIHLDNLFYESYERKFDGFVSDYQRQPLTSSIPFIRMYKWVLKSKIKAGNQMMKEVGLSTKL